MANKSSLENMLRSLVDPGNKEQNQQIPPRVFDTIYNIVSSFYKSGLVNAYPVGLDILRPFMKTEVIGVKNGEITLPLDYRDMLGRPSITSRKDGSGECGEETKIEDKQEFKIATLKSGCKSVAIDMLNQNEWDDRTQSEYKAPTYLNPIGCFFDANVIKVCPYDLAVVKVRYAVEEKFYRYGYINQPDDTYIYDKSTSVETEWGDNAFPALYKGCLALYSNFLRDPQLVEASKILNQIGMF